MPELTKLKLEAKGLNQAQEKAVKYNDGPLLIVAGAGTGKTTVLSEKIAYLIREKIAKPEEILAVTFTEKATAEMEERIGNLVQFGTYDLTVSTFHALAQTILEACGLDMGLPNNFKVLNEVETWLLVRQNLDKFNLDYYRPLGNPTKFIHALLKHFSRCKDELISPEDYLKYAESVKLNTDNLTYTEKKTKAKKTKKVEESGEEDLVLEPKRIEEIANAYHVYNQLLLDHGALDFADLIQYTVKLFSDRPKILKEYQEKFKFILVDEFQDTNWAQYALVKLLVKNITKPFLTVVGDDDQSIYKFRGASVSNILQFKDDFPKAKEIVLSENYRSGQKILDFAHNFIQLNNPDRLETKLNINKRLEAKQPWSGEVEFLYGQNAGDEARLVIEKIKELKTEFKLNWKDFAILCRANKQAEQFIPVFLEEHIPYEFLSTAGLFRQKVVLDSMAFLRLIDNYHESSALFRVLNSPVYKVNHEDWSKLLQEARKRAASLYEIVRDAEKGNVDISSEGREVLTKLLETMDKCAKLSKTESAAKVLYTFWNGSGYLQLLSNQAEEHYRDILHLQSLFSRLEKFSEENIESTVHAWLNYYEFILEYGEDNEVTDDLNTGEDAVKLMTIHGAKGLEFPYVFVPNLVDQRFPTNHRGEPIELPVELVRESALPTGDHHLQEERRLFYVAITRAKKGLYLTAAKNYGGVREKKISRFLKELNETSGLLLHDEPKAYTNLLEKFQDTEKPKNQGFYPVPDSFSFSQLQVYNKCPYQYRFQFVLQIPTFGKGVFSFGRTMHLTLQKFYERIVELNSTKQNSLFAEPKINEITSNTVKKPALDELLNIYYASWQDDWYHSAKQKKEYYEKGEEILREFYRLGETSGWTVPIGLESGFRFKLGGAIIKGQIDRLDRGIDGKLILTDYKTGKPKEKLTFEDKEQLLIYQIASESVLELRNEGEVGELRYYYLDDNSVQSFLGKPEDLDKVKTKISETIESIRTNNFEPKPSKEVCAYCDFKEICDFRL